jgi:hypothetical protein
MSVVAAAIIGSAALGYVSSQEASANQKKGLGIAQTQFEFDKQQYADWKSMYGGLEENLSDFYNGLTPEYATTQGLQQQQQAYQEGLTKMKEQLAKSGAPTGAQADIQARAALENARNRATIRAEAPYKVAEQKQSFLNLGIQSKQQAVAGVGQGSTNLQNAYANQATIASQEANDAFGAAASLATTYGRSAGLGSANTSNTTSVK